MVDNGLYFLKIIPGNLSMLTLDHFYFFNVGRNDLTVLLFTSRYTEHKLLPYEGAVSRCSLLCRSHDQNLTDDSIISGDYSGQMIIPLLVSLSHICTAAQILPKYGSEAKRGFLHPCIPLIAEADLPGEV